MRMDGKPCRWELHPVIDGQLEPCDGTCELAAKDCRESGRYYVTIIFDEGHFWLEGESSHNEVPITYCPWCGGKLEVRDA